MSRNNKVVPVYREHEFREINGCMVIVGKPRPAELAGLKAHFSIKPWSSSEERRDARRITLAAEQSLKFVK